MAELGISRRQLRGCRVSARRPFFMRPELWSLLLHQIGCNSQHIQQKGEDQDDKSGLHRSVFLSRLEESFVVRSAFKARPICGAGRCSLQSRSTSHEPDTIPGTVARTNRTGQPWSLSSSPRPYSPKTPSNNTTNLWPPIPAHRYNPTEFSKRVSATRWILPLVPVRDPAEPDCPWPKEPPKLSYLCVPKGIGTHRRYCV